MCNTETPYYSTVRTHNVRESESQLQNTAPSHYSAVLILTTSDSHKPTPHYGYALACIPSGSLVYHRLFP
jgi:hypothetical protein